MSFPISNPTSSVFRSYSPGPHSGIDPDPDAHVADDSIEGRARTALTLGLLSLVLGVLTGVPAIWYGRTALVRIGAADGELRGRGHAWAGIALGVVGIALTVGAWLYLHLHA